MDISTGVMIFGSVLIVGIVITLFLIGSRKPDYSQFEDEDRPLD